MRTHMHELTESSLHKGDLRNLVSNIFEIDSYSSKMGEDKDIITLSFTVESRAPSDDLISFIEKGYKFVLDADMSPGELSNGKYRVFVEIKRDNSAIDNLLDLLYGLEKLTDISNFKFRYYKSFNSEDATKENLEHSIPLSPEEYEIKIKEQTFENFQNFFNKSYLESIEMLDDQIQFKKVYGDPVHFKFVNSGPKHQILESILDKISINYNDMSEVLFLTKYIGNYNITKFGNKFVFENNNYAVVLEKLL